MFGFKKVAMPSASEALRGRDQAIPTATEHFVNHHALKAPYPAGFEKAMFGLGCFWGAEKSFWELGDGVYVTAVGYAGGMTPNPTYEEVCSGRTGQNEVVLVVYGPKKISYDALLKTFWEGHDPTQGMRQKKAAEASKAMYQAELNKKGYGTITTEIVDAPPFYFAEDYHQQYLAKNPFGYCGHGGTGVSCPIGLGAKLTQPAQA
jgi:peptide-methionine (S)-S-oxide reductase